MKQWLIFYWVLWFTNRICLSLVNGFAKKKKTTKKLLFLVSGSTIGNLEVPTPF